MIADRMIYRYWEPNAHGLFLLPPPSATFSSRQGDGASFASRTLAAASALSKGSRSPLMGERSAGKAPTMESPGQLEAHLRTSDSPAQCGSSCSNADATQDLLQEEAQQRLERKSTHRSSRGKNTSHHRISSAGGSVAATQDSAEQVEPRKGLTAPMLKLLLHLTLVVIFHSIIFFKVKLWKCDVATQKCHCDDCEYGSSDGCCNASAGVMMLYLLVCTYLMISGRQLRLGYPSLLREHPLTDSGNFKSCVFASDSIRGVTRSSKRRKVVRLEQGVSERWKRVLTCLHWNDARARW